MSDHLSWTILHHCPIFGVHYNVLEKLHPYYSRLLTFIEEIRLQSNLQNNFVTESLKSNNRTYKIPEYFPPIMNGFIDNTPKIIDIIKKGNKSKYYSDPSLLEFLTLEPNASDYGIKLNEAIPEPVLESHKY